MYKFKKGLSLRKVEQKGKTIELTLGWSPYTSKKIIIDQKFLPILKDLVIGIDGEGLSEKHPETRKSDRDRLVLFLKDNNILQSIDYQGRYSRHLMFYDLLSSDAASVQKKISESVITVIGVGGIGCWTSLNLACLGVGEIRLVDADIVEESNLTRQVLFSENDIGKRKVDIAKNRIEAFNSGIIVRKYIENISSTNQARNIIENSDVVILSADYPPGLIQGWTAEACKSLEVPCINAGYLDITGTILRLTEPENFFTPGNTVQNTMSEITEIQNVFADNYKAPSFGPINSMVSSIAAMEAFKAIIHYGPEFKEIYIDPLSLEIDSCVI